MDRATRAAARLLPGGAWAVGLLLLVLATPHELRAASCSVSATPVAFGMYDVFRTTPTDGIGSVSISCNQDWVIARVSLSTGQSGTFSARRMRGAADVLHYNLYRNANRTVVWGDGSGGTSVVYVLAPASAVTVYGRIPANQDPAAGTYTDAVTVSIDY